MDRLKYIEILCLRVSEGLGTERDFKRLRSAGIDPNDWIGLSDVLKTALKSPPVSDFSPNVCRDLNIDVLDVCSALRPETTPDLSQGVYQKIQLGSSPVEQASGICGSGTKRHNYLFK